MSKEKINSMISKLEEHASIQIVKFVQETTPESAEDLGTIPTFRMHYVTKGKGLLCTATMVQTIREGDVFFTFPSIPYSIETEKELQYGYISYLGKRAKSIKEELKLGETHCIFTGIQELPSLWEGTRSMPQEVFNIYCESILLRVFAEIGVRFFEKKDNARQEKNAGLLIKKYIDENYSDMELSLEKIGDRLGYHRKYVSMAFKEEFSVGFANYLNSVRVHQACVLMEHGFTSVQDISAMCGFRDPYYFSRVFKDYVKVSPKVHMETLAKGEKENDGSL